jgi:hypothetical protein
MKLALLIISTAALALATPIIPTMVYDLPSVTAPTDEPHLPAATTTDDPIPIIPKFPEPVIEPRPWWRCTDPYKFPDPNPWEPTEFEPFFKPGPFCATVAKLKEWKEMIGM